MPIIPMHDLPFQIYDPEIHDFNDIPEQSGIYIFCVKDLKKLNIPLNSLEYAHYRDFPVFYVGVSKTNMRRRINTMHYSGSARNSTLRESIGCLFHYEKHYLGDGRYRFIKSDENKISQYMKKNLLVFYHQRDEYLAYKQLLMHELYPPFNLEGNISDINNEFRNKLSLSRGDSEPFESNTAK